MSDSNNSIYPTPDNSDPNNVTPAGYDSSNNLHSESTPVDNRAGYTPNSEYSQSGSDSNQDNTVQSNQMYQGYNQPQPDYAQSQPQYQQGYTPASNMHNSYPGSGYNQSPYSQAPQNAYPQGAYQQQGYSPTRIEGEQLAQQSMIFGIISIFVLGVILGPIAIVKANKAEKLNVSATAGKVTGWIGSIFGVLQFFYIVLILLFAIGSAASY